jgi:hypothetical protein
LIYPIDKRGRKTLFLSKKYSDFFHRVLRSFRAERSVVEKSSGIHLCVVPRDPSTPLGMTKKRAVWTLISTAATSRVHFARSAMKPFWRLCPEGLFESTRSSNKVDHGQETTAHALSRA